LNGIIFENREIRPDFVITINGYNATSLGVSVEEQDIIAIFPPIAGG
jgi:molybdopterin converting factor small subunit